MNSKKRKFHPIAILITLLTLGLAICALAFMLNRPGDDTTAESPTDTPKDDPTPDPDPMPEVLSLTLPGTTPITDIKAEYFTPTGIWFLVNKTSPLENSAYYPNDLVRADILAETGKLSEELSVRSVVKQPLEYMAQAAKVEGVDLMIASAFRSYDRQQFYYDNMVSAYGVDQADRLSARPGTSEHQLGLAIDFTTPGNPCRLETCFESTPAGKWLAAHAHEYGFILRYPKNSESTTGYMYEPWHFRYVGIPLATAFFKSSLTTYEAVWPYLEAVKAKL